uniref:peptidylprolyl isomerase n=1 Tax=Steinernema glaseri TaxID=37863 RepID=A0A1I7ZGK1_9BILA
MDPSGEEKSSGRKRTYEEHEQYAVVDFTPRARVEEDDEEPGVTSEPSEKMQEDEKTEEDKDSISEQKNGEEESNEEEGKPETNEGDEKKEDITEEPEPDTNPVKAKKARLQENDEESKDAAPPKKVLLYEDTYLRSIPKAAQYEKSFMHRDTLSHVLATSTHFIITASIDGHLKFWKKKHAEGIEFVKHFRCHSHKFADVKANHNGTLLATICTEDRSAKIFDVTNFDMINMLRFDFAPGAACWVHQGADVVPALAVSDRHSPAIHIYDGKGSGEKLFTVTGHMKPVTMMQYSAKLNIAISVDEMGVIEYWSGPKTDYKFPPNVSFEFKSDTDLYELPKNKVYARSMAISPTGHTFALYCSDCRIRIFKVKSGKLLKVIDETLAQFIEKGKQEKLYGLPNMEWNRRIALEKDLEKDPENIVSSMILYDDSGNFLIYPTIIGIRVYNLVTDEVTREIARTENTRFMALALCRAMPDISDRLQGAAVTIEVEAAENPNLKRYEPDPMLVAIAHKKNRFYLFTNAEPFISDDAEATSSRDVFNEKPRKEDALTALDDGNARSKIADKAVVHTTYGDIHVELFPDECPKAVENFCTHARRGYYNGHMFHRVIKSFMIQTGDPTGKGTGGQSIWGADFEDEFHPRLRFDKPYCLAMANAGPNTNGSQFFITVIPADWLDGKNTLFGHVTEGFNVVQKISNVSTFEKSGRPKTEISIISITLKS